MGIRVQNIDVFRGWNKKMDREIQKALHQAGRILESKSKRIVPVDTGRLRRSINFIVVPIKKGWRLVFGSGIKGGKQVHYAPFIEYGTRYIRPYRYLRGALDINRMKIRLLVQRAVHRGLTK